MRWLAWRSPQGRQPARQDSTGQRPATRNCEADLEQRSTNLRRDGATGSSAYFLARWLLVVGRRRLAAGGLARQAMALGREGVDRHRGDAPDFGHFDWGAGGH